MSTTKGIHYVNPNDERISLGKVSREPQSELDKDAFMQLLVTQLRYQDPLDPMDNQEFMAQMAQFSALEQMMNISSTMESSTAHGLIGKVVEASYQDPATNTLETIVGKVDGVVMKNKKNFLLINGKEIELKDVESVIDPNLVSDTGITSGFELIGKTVQATIRDKDTEKDYIYEGEVHRIIMKDGEPYVLIGAGENEVIFSIDDVNSVIDKPTITGKQAVATIINEEGNEETIEGIVDYILVIDNKIKVSIDGKLTAFENLSEVYK